MSSRVTLIIYSLCRESFTDKLTLWRAYYDDKAPQNAELPAPWHDNLKEFERMMVLRCIRPDKVGIVQNCVRRTDMYRRSVCQGATGN